MVLYHACAFAVQPREVAVHTRGEAALTRGSGWYQCRERWHNHLNPDINKDAWSATEVRVHIYPETNPLSSSVCRNCVACLREIEASDSDVLDPECAAAQRTCVYNPQY